MSVRVSVPNPVSWVSVRVKSASPTARTWSRPAARPISQSSPPWPSRITRPTGEGGGVQGVGAGSAAQVALFDAVEGVGAKPDELARVAAAATQGEVGIALARPRGRCRRRR